VSEVLTPEQIAELVAAAKSGEIPQREQARGRRPRRVRELDFTRPVKLAPDQQRRFERTHEAFCRTASTRLSAELRTPIELEVINVEQVTWSVAVASVPVPSIFGVISTQPLETTILVSAEQQLVFRFIELLIGGTSSETRMNRTLTEIELALARRTFHGLVEQLSVAWNELFGLDLHLVDLEAIVANVELAPPSEPTVVLTIEARSGQSSSTMSLLVPYRAIAAVGSRLSGQYADVDAPAQDEELEAALEAAIGGVEVEAAVEVGSLVLTIDDVLALKAGDVVQLHSRADEGATVCIGATRLYRAKPGRSGSRRAIEITEGL
jgi:flagellar motor switch protein FliM